MSKWGLGYKGTEILTPEEWNAVVDALEELNARAPQKIKGGTFTANGDGATTQFDIEHGMGETPNLVLVGAMSEDASGDKWWDVDETYIHVYFKTAPPSGTENVKLWWLALKLG